MDLKHYLASTKDSLAEHIISLLEEKKKELPNHHQFFERLLDILQTFSVQGKLSRGCLVCLGFDMYKSTDEKGHVKDAAAALELLHSGLLIHDDIMDNDLLRRGQETVFANYIRQAEEQELEQAQFYGQSMGFTAAAIVYFYAMELFTRAHPEPLRTNNVIRLVSSEIELVGSAQMLDFHYGVSAEEISIEKILAIYRHKTARYSFSLPLMIGAMLAGAKPEEYFMLGSLGESLGILFQIKDDEIGIFGTEEMIGKPIGSDLRENKKTLIRALLFNHVKGKDALALDAIFGNPEISKEMIDEIKQLCTRYDILKEIDKMTQSLSVESLEQVSRLSCRTEYKELLIALIEDQKTRLK